MSGAAPVGSDGGAILNLHASAAVVGEDGLLIRGRSGAGKTRLILACVAEARRQGRFARLVADDRTLVTPRGDRLVARPHPALAGLVERRGLGVARVDHEPACVLSLVVDIVEGLPPRMPEPEDRRCEIARVAVSRLALAAGASTADAVALIFSVLASLGTGA